MIVQGIIAFDFPGLCSIFAAGKLPCAFETSAFSANKHETVGAFFPSAVEREIIILIEADYVKQQGITQKFVPKAIRFVGHGNRFPVITLAFGNAGIQRLCIGGNRNFVFFFVRGVCARKLEYRRVPHGI